MVALFGAAIVAVVVATSASPVARADPPPSHFGPWLEVSPGRGNPQDSFKASYWYVDSDACQYATVTFYWDGKDVGTSTVDSATCSGINGGVVSNPNDCAVDRSASRPVSRPSWTNAVLQDFANA